MAREADIATPVPLLAASTQGNPAPTLVRLALDAGFAVALLAALVWSIVKFQLPTSGESYGSPVGPVLLATLFPVWILVLLSLIERLFPPAGPRKSVRNWFLHLQISIFYSFLAVLVTALSTVFCTRLARSLGFNLGLIDLRFAQGRGVLALVGAGWLYAIVVDFFFYWYHLLLHKVPFLWALHKLHHMDQELEALTVYRQNWFDVIVAAVLVTIPMVLFVKADDLDPWKVGILAGTVTVVFSTLITLGHVNVRLQAGKASVLWCTPQVHRIHHSRLPEHHDKNFAFMFPLWDVIFGTYYAPKWNEFPPTGVDGEKEIESFWESQIFTQREWMKMFRAWRERRDATDMKGLR